MKKITVLILIFLLFGCKYNENLNISELNFSDLNQVGISKNKIKKTYLISGYNTPIYNKNDTIEIIEYNRNGNIKKSWRKSFMYSIDKEFEYDSLNLEIHKIHFTDFKAIFNFSYEFNEDSLILYKFYMKPTMGLSEDDLSKPAGVFKFNDKGKILESYHYQNNDYGKGKKLTTKYQYDSLGLLSSKEIIYESSDNEQPFSKSNSITNYHYSNNKIDSTVTVFNWTDNENQEQSYSSKTLYDNDGLISKYIVKDSLVTYYKHIK